MGTGPPDIFTRTAMRHIRTDMRLARVETYTVRVSFDRIGGQWVWWLLDSRLWPVESGWADTYVNAKDAALSKLAEVNP
jgi:hypothetical protein